MTQLPAPWRAAIDEWTDYARAGGSPATTVRTRCEHLSRLGRSIHQPDPWRVTGPVLLSWCARQAWATETRRAHRTTYRGFWRWGVETGRCEVSAALALPSIKPSPPRPRPTPDDVYRVALATGDARSRLMMRLAAEAGLRRAEVAGIHERDVLTDLTGWTLHGKGGRDRLVPLPDPLALAVRAGLARTGGGWLFPGDDHGHLSPRWVGKVVTDLLPGEWTMHSLRHRFASRANEANPGDVFALQTLLGHASPATTRMYVAVPDARLRAMVESAA
ncbi:tyrosine-type recombinase/integrase [Nocardioides sp. InS609-2]|uniref:tyrosine-type recombinase/integrase n=1 Tax=Nocardioides sp. InS609-2 TaxID=2760705 RepID=UPI0020C1216C|nr:tyrosine-type recombinase/integrase [Nocardioides sp. InS609-2]